MKEFMLSDDFTTENLLSILGITSDTSPALFNDVTWSGFTAVFPNLRVMKRMFASSGERIATQTFVKFRINISKYDMEMLDRFLWMLHENNLNYTTTYDSSTFINQLNILYRDAAALKEYEKRVVAREAQEKLFSDVAQILNKLV